MAAPPPGCAGSMLWTHFGISGPAALDLSRHWLRARLEGRAAEATANLTPDLDFEVARRFLARAGTPSSSRDARHDPRDADSRGGCGRRAGGSSASTQSTTLASLTRDERRRVCHALTAWPIPIVDSRGYNFAEATAGGVDLQRDRSGDDGVEALSGALPGRRDARRRRPPWRVQLSVGLVERGRRRRAG